MVVVVNLVGQKVNGFTSKIASADLVAPLSLTTWYGRGSSPRNVIFLNGPKIVSE